MDADRWALLSPLLDELLELDDDLRHRRLAQLKIADPALASELRQLLAVEKQSDAFIAEPLMARHEQHALVGDRIGAYRLLQLLGTGGMGQVWLALDERSPDAGRVALKLLRADLADPHLRGRFLRERDILASLGHPQIPRLRDAGSDAGGQLYLALDYIQGQPITTRCQQLGLSPEACVALFLHVCAALSHVHSRGVVHRDLKPSNILVDVEGKISLLDFGIAQRVNDAADAIPASGDRTFTLHYAAPEQIRGEPCATTADVYSLGVVLYELLAGQKPYRLRRQSDAEWERAVLRAEVTPPSAALDQQHASAGVADPAKRVTRLRGALDAIVLKALRKSACDRYPSVDAFADDLCRWQRGQSVSAEPHAAPHRWLQWIRRNLAGQTADA
ncbi:MAG TPA: serine/threonine-protein kinase [Stenotrophomonas sp.]|nr:serine/threonine-protein kinase [Stenotrophomonas sp.]